MISILHYISASRRLKEWDKTISLMGGPEHAGNQMMAQRDMVEMEKSFYREEMDDLFFEMKVTAIILSFFCICVIAIFTIMKG